ncbi:TPA: BlaI/MecI/CopY family transcriptional regulator [Candidatus Poribacteria bacterium]|nr:BlaI/MecI/CopY family transcriptional regulator [Candidatus Poribacteria bacterium]
MKSLIVYGGIVMPRKKSPTLTEAELRLMNILWEKGKATVKDVVSALPKEQPLAYSTVLTMLRILERKGYLRHEKQSRAFVYYPIIGHDEARRSVVNEIVSRFFDNSPELLVLNILENERIDTEELVRLRKMIQSSEEEEAL